LEVAKRLMATGDDGQASVKDWHSECEATGMRQSTRYDVLAKLHERGDLVVDGESGLVVPSGSASHLAGAISYLMEHPEARRDMGRRARERIDTGFRIEDTIRKTAELYRELLNSG
jgi:hypothetical protein